jgi:hypothetical protein
MNNHSERSPGANTEGAPKGGEKVTALTDITFLAKPERAFGANDCVCIAVCGNRGQGFTHVEEYSRLHNVEVAVGGNVDENILNQRLLDMDRMALPNPFTFSNPSRLMEEKSLDAVTFHIAWVDGCNSILRQSK